MWWKKLNKTKGINPLYDRWKTASSNEEKRAVMIDLMETHPEIIPYLWNRAETCFGEHTVYLVNIIYKGTPLIKIGYTKNSVEARFSEKRYEGSQYMKLVSVIREAKLQARGATEFEKWMKSQVQPMQTDMTMPGKGELFHPNQLDVLTTLWDKRVAKYESITGIKSPN